jgi:hypothetical protein
MMTKAVNNYKQLGDSGLRRTGGYVYEEFLPQLRWPRAGNIYKEMADNDPVVGAILYLAEMLIRNVDWKTEGMTDSAEDKAAAEFLQECMDDMDMSWNDTISEILSVLTYGYSFHEVVYKIRRGPEETNAKYRSQFTDGKVGWRRIPVRSQATLWEWEFAEDGDIKAFVQQGEKRQVVIPLSKGLLFRTRVSRDNPEGKSLLRNAYRPWYFKKRIEEIEGIGIERDLAGLPMLTAPEGMDLWSTTDENMVALKANAEKLVQSIRRDAEEGILLPNGWELKLLSTGSSRQFDTNTIINRYDNRIAITMLSDLILIGSDNTGSFAMAESKQSLLATALEAQLDNIAQIFNKYAVNKLLRINNMPGKAKIVPGEVESPSVKEVSLLLRAMGLDISKDHVLQNHLRKIASFPELNDSDFKEIYAEQGDVAKAEVAAKNAEKIAADQAEAAEADPENNVDDTVENDFEQNDLDYAGQEK